MIKSFRRAICGEFGTKIGEKYIQKETYQSPSTADIICMWCKNFGSESRYLESEQVMNARKISFSLHRGPAMCTRLALIATLGLAIGHAQVGLTIPQSHPRVWFDGANGARLAQAKTWFQTHPFSPSTMEDWALHYLLTGNAGDCTGANHAIAQAKNLTIALSELEGVASDNLRWNAEAVALVYDWCYAQMAPSDAQLLLDRWNGATAGPSDPVHTPTDLASVAGSSILTSSSGPFLPNMGGNNLIVITGGSHCKTGIFGIVSYTDANTVTLDRDPTTGGNASGCTGRIGGYIDIARQGQWGGLRSPGGNYNWGYYRTEVLWGIATSGESAYSATFLDDALGPVNSRWSTFLPYANGTGAWVSPTDNAKGGILSEGSEYGQYAWGYQATPNWTAKMLGRDLFAETNWFREAVYYIIYSTTVGPTKGNATNAFYQFFPMSDDENGVSTNGAYPTVVTTPSIPNGGYYGGMMLTAAQEYAGVAVGQHARQWLNTINPGFLRFQAAVDPGGTAASFSSLPLDYYSSGIGTLVSKNSWNSSATQMRTISGLAGSSNHAHRNSGDFAMLRNGAWLTRETANYATNIVGSYGQTAPVSGGEAHNVIGLGPATATTCNVSQGPGGADGFGRTVRLDSQPNYSYQVIDLTQAYRSTKSSQLCRDDNPYAGGIQREFLFIRPLDTLVIFDRILAVDDRKPGDTHPSVLPAANVKTVYLHSIVAPVLSGNTATFTTQGQTLKVYTLLPAAPGYNVVNEGNQAQQRLEIRDTGQAQSYILNVLQGRDSSTGQDFTTATVTDNGTYYSVALQHPTLGSAVITFAKGSTSTGGSFGYAASGNPVPTPLANAVNTPVVSDTGVAWPSLSSGSPCDLNGDGKVDLNDVNLAVQQALGKMACTADLDQNGACNVIDVQRIINATITGVCRIGP